MLIYLFHCVFYLFNCDIYLFHVFLTLHLNDFVYRTMTWHYVCQSTQTRRGHGRASGSHTQTKATDRNNCRLLKNRLLRSSTCTVYCIPVFVQVNTNTGRIYPGKVLTTETCLQQNHHVLFFLAAREQYYRIGRAYSS